MIAQISQYLNVPIEKISPIDSNNSFIIKNQEIKDIHVDFWNLKAHIEFDWCVFNNPIAISQKQIHLELFFGHCVFLKCINVLDTQFYSQIVFHACVFEKKVFFNPIKNSEIGVHFYNKLDFEQSRFLDEARFLKTTFHNEAIFRDVFFMKKTSFDFINCYGIIDFELSEFQDSVSFIKSNFENKLNFFQTIFLGQTTFSKNHFPISPIFDFANFDKSVTFYHVTFYDSLLFNMTKIKNANFVNTKFLKPTIFSKTILDNCSFLSQRKELNDENEKTTFDCLIFSECNFLRNNTFCDVDFLSTEKFADTPFFIQCVFDDQFNIKNEYLRSEINFDDTKELILGLTVCSNQHENAECMRDFFRRIKSNRISRHNIIDASKFATKELYSQEIELKLKPQKKLKEWIDWAQLFFYRNTSDHHTDTLKSFHTLIALIGVFGLLCGAIVLGFDYFAFDYKGGLDILSLKEAYSSHIKTSIQSHTWGYFLGNIALILAFIGLFLGVVWKCSRDILIPLGYLMTLGFLATSPKYLIPAMSLFGGGRAVLDPLGIVGGVYTLLFGFLAYSFIKTIRKNSIIPS